MRRICVLALLLSMALGLSGCGGGTTVRPVTATDPPKSQSQVAFFLTLW